MRIFLPLLGFLILVFAYIYKENYSVQNHQYDAKLYGVLNSNFNLESAQGNKTLDDFKGKPLILYFGFTACPDVCPMSLSYLRSALKDIDQDSYQVIFISLDYKRDKPQDVQKYVDYFGKNFIGLTGSQDQIEQVAKNYNVYFNFVKLEDSELNYTVDHTSRFFILNKSGQAIKSIRSDEDQQTFLNEFMSVLGEKS